jgi:hypothetical protein
MLYENGIIKYPTVYELFIRLKEESTDYLVGEYEISPSMNYGDINDAFTYVANIKEQVSITVPEGYTVDQIIDLLVKNGVGTREGFVAAINEFDYDYRFMEGLDKLDSERKYRLEGYLFPDTYYFSQPCVSTVIQEDGTSYPDLEITEAMFARSSVLIGKYKGVTAGGIEVDESWRPNDGLVNTLSARAPLNAPQKEFDPDHIEKGIWNVFPDYHGDHSSLQGGYTINRDPYPFYENLLNIISGLE